jgi:hypothetical protein
MDFGALPAIDGSGIPVSDGPRRLAWFERSSTEGADACSAAERGLADSSGLLDRFREADGLVYSGDCDYDL